MRRKARFRSNRTKAPMQQFACVRRRAATAYMPLHGFTAVDLGYQQGDAVSNIVNKFDEPPMTAQYLQLFDQIWNDPRSWKTSPRPSATTSRRSIRRTRPSASTS